MVTDVMAPVVKRVRAYFAPVDRSLQKAAIFDPAQNAGFDPDQPPSPWVDLGWVHHFTRTSGTVVAALRSGAPANTQLQARTDVEATVRFSFESWGKLQLSLSSGTQQMNLLATQSGAANAASGGLAISATNLQSGSTANALQVGVAGQSGFSVGSLLAVDLDYVAGVTGFLGSGVSGAYVKNTLTDVDYVRRITLNVGRIRAIDNGVLSLEQPLIAGPPTAGMKVNEVVGFCDREGSSFFQEWSALFVGEGQQGERVIWHYPRLQSMAGIAEEKVKSAGGYDSLSLLGCFRALPVTDPLDGERVVCFRSYIAG